MNTFHRETLLVLPSVHACVDAINTLHSQFKAHYKRNAAVELLYSNTFSLDPMREGEPDGHLVTLQVAELTEAARAEIAWFKTAAHTLANA